MEETGRERNKNLKAIRQLAHERRLKVNAKEKNCSLTPSLVIESNAGSNHGAAAAPEESKTAGETCFNREKDRMERELSSLLFEWESLPKLIEEKGGKYFTEAKRIAQLNEDMVDELRSRGISLPEEFAMEDVTIQEPVANVAAVGAAY